MASAHDEAPPERLAGQRADGNTGEFFDPFDPDQPFDPFDPDAYQPPVPWYQRTSAVVASSLILIAVIAITVSVVLLITRGTSGRTTPTPQFVDPSFSASTTTTPTAPPPETITSTVPPITTDITTTDSSTDTSVSTINPPPPPEPVPGTIRRNPQTPITRTGISVAPPRRPAFPNG